MEDLTAQFEARNRVRKRYEAALTPEQRLQRLAALLDEGSRLLAQNPEAMERFWKRNLRKRAARRESIGTP